MPANAANSLWQATAPSVAPRAPLPGDATADVTIVGGGFTGLWTAHSLLRSDPTLRVLVLERDHVGFGASGRNGGWCSALLPMGLTAMAADHDRDAAVRMQRAMFHTVDEIERVAKEEGIDCHLSRGGTVTVARNAVQAQRLRDELDEVRSFGFGDDDYRWLSPEATNDRVAITGSLGASYTPHCAAVHPLRLVHGLAAAVERLGAVIHEGTAVRSISGGTVVTEHGTVRTDVVVRATEAFTPQLAGMRRAIAPIYSLMIATEPLPAEVWEQIGLSRRETFNDARRMIIYGQRTADDRLAFGGRGAPYHFASAIRPAFDTDDQVHAALAETLRELFPAIGDAAITHRWGGAVGVPRDWQCSVGFDETTGIGWAGGYVGDGVATTNLAGRTLADLITRSPSDLTDLPWVNHRSPSWEPEPLRWLGINAVVRLPVGADRHEQRTGRPAKLRSAILNRLTKH